VKITYDPDEIDFFFAVDGDFTCYLIPVAKVGGFRMIHLAGYAAYRLEQLHPAARRRPGPASRSRQPCETPPSVPERPRV
jgi:hypothetical protein